MGLRLVPTFTSSILLLVPFTYFPRWSLGSVRIGPRSAVPCKRWCQISCNCNRVCSQDVTEAEPCWRSEIFFWDWALFLCKFLVLFHYANMASVTWANTFYWLRSLWHATVDTVNGGQRVRNQSLARMRQWVIHYIYEVSTLHRCLLHLLKWLFATRYCIKIVEIFEQKLEQFVKRRFQLKWYRTSPNDDSKGSMLGN